MPGACKAAAADCGDLLSLQKALRVCVFVEMAQPVTDSVRTANACMQCCELRDC
jgi:hypothetical protein